MYICIYIYIYIDITRPFLKPRANSTSKVSQAPQALFPPHPVRRTPSRPRRDRQGDGPFKSTRLCCVLKEATRLRTDGLSTFCQLKWSYVIFVCSFHFTNRKRWNSMGFCFGIDLHSLWMFHIYFWRVAHQKFGFHYRNSKGGLSITDVDNYSGVLGIKHGDSSNNRRYNQPTKVLEIQPTTLYCNFVKI